MYTEGFVLDSRVYSWNFGIKVAWLLTRRPTTTAAPKRKQLTPRQWLSVLSDYGARVECQICHNKYRLEHVQRDHIGAREITHKDGPEEFQPACIACHKEKTHGTKATRAGSDRHKISKTKKLESARLAHEAGEAKAKKMKPKIQSRGFDKRFKKKLSGEVVEREPRT